MTLKIPYYLHRWDSQSELWKSSDTASVTKVVRAKTEQILNFEAQYNQLFTCSLSRPFRPIRLRIYSYSFGSSESQRDTAIVKFKYEYGRETRIARPVTKFLTFAIAFTHTGNPTPRRGGTITAA